jgi:integrase/recombinase XerD
LHLTSTGAGTPKINATVSALRFFFRVTLDRSDLLSRPLSTIHEPPKEPVILSPYEMTRFLKAAPDIKCKAALSVGYAAGLRVRVIQVLLETTTNCAPTAEIGGRILFIGRSSCMS